MENAELSNPLLLECLTDIKDHIQEELAINSLDRFSEKEIHAITEQLLAKKELSASNRTLSMLEEERIKFQFFSTLASEIQFEYTAEPSMLTLSDWGAKKLGISRFIRNPLENEKLLSIISQKQMLQLAQTLRSVTPEHPVIECNAVLKLGNTHADPSHYLPYTLDFWKQGFLQRCYRQNHGYT